MTERDSIISSHEHLLMAIQNESRKFQEYYLWLEKYMPQSFFEEVSQENLMLIAHSLMGFQLQEYFSTIHLKRAAIVICLDSADADLRILENYAFYGIKNYQSYISVAPFPSITENLRIGIIYFTETIETIETPYPEESKQKLRLLVKQRNPNVTDEEFEKLFSGINTRFLRSLPMDRLILALDLFFRTKDRDNCQYEILYNEDWQDTPDASSMQIVLAWRNTPKHNFLYRIARTIFRHGLTMKRVNATYINPYSKQNTLIMALWLHGSNGQAVWDVADIIDFIRELVTVKYFPSFDLVDQYLVSKGFVTGNLGHMLRAMIFFIHQSLVHIDSYIYTLSSIEETLIRHPEFSSQLCEAFMRKFDPDNHNYDLYVKLREKFLVDVHNLDTGQIEKDNIKKNILLQAMSFIHHTLKTNYYRLNYTALSFRLDPKYLDAIPFDRTKKFPELPYGIFFIKGMHFFGFHIRFKELARGGLRTVVPPPGEHIDQERNSIFTECYNLAYTQHMKNKDIPEGGSKGIIFLKPFDRLESETLIFQNELERAKVNPVEIKAKIEKFSQEQKIEHLQQAQRSFIESFLVLINAEPDGKLRPKYILDYWKKTEYIYLGPDENMSDEMIQWIANFSKNYNYKPGTSFISGKPIGGINHKEYGVTSLGVNVYMEYILRFLGIDPSKDTFTVKMSGGPDGDVAGNQMVNLYKYYPKTAQVVAITDISGTIFDPEGLDLADLNTLFKQGRPIKYYSPQKLHPGGYLLDKNAKRQHTAYAQQTLCWRNKNGKIIEDWLSGNEMNGILRHSLHQIRADIFITGGGRPRTLNESNFKDFLDEKGTPTSKAIIEGANLYITPKARHELEKLGVLIVKDSSANKTGVICSSFEVLCGLTLEEDLFSENKTSLVKEIIERLKSCAANEAELLLKEYQETGEFMSNISNRISEHINLFTYQLLDYLDTIQLSNDANDPLLKTFLNYCLPTLRNHYQQELIREIPEHHKKAIIACSIASHLVYKRGLAWYPSIVDILPVLLMPNQSA